MSVTGILLNLCLEDFTLFLREKGNVPGINKVYLLKWTLCAHESMLMALLNMMLRSQSLNDPDSLRHTQAIGAKIHSRLLLILIFIY